MRFTNCNIAEAKPLRDLLQVVAQDLGMQIFAGTRTLNTSPGPKTITVTPVYRPEDVKDWGRYVYSITGDAVKKVLEDTNAPKPKE